MKALIWLQANYKELLGSLVAIIVGIQALFRLFPTKYNDGFWARVDSALSTVMDFLHVPNVLTAEGKKLLAEQEAKDAAAKAAAPVDPAKPQS